jgi:hypothetical protein
MECVFNGCEGFEEFCAPFSFSSDGSATFLEVNFFLSEGSDRCCAPFLFFQKVQEYFWKGTFFFLKVLLNFAHLFFFF